MPLVYTDAAGGNWLVPRGQQSAHSGSLSAPRQTTGSPAPAPAPADTVVSHPGYIKSALGPAILLRYQADARVDIGAFQNRTYDVLPAKITGEERHGATRGSGFVPAEGWPADAPPDAFWSKYQASRWKPPTGAARRANHSNQRTRRRGSGSASDLDVLQAAAGEPATPGDGCAGLGYQFSTLPRNHRAGRQRTGGCRRNGQRACQRRGPQDGSGGAGWPPSVGRCVVSYHNFRPAPGSLRTGYDNTYCLPTDLPSIAQDQGSGWMVTVSARTITNRANIKTTSQTDFLPRWIAASGTLWRPNQAFCRAETIPAGFGNWRATAVVSMTTTWRLTRFPPGPALGRPWRLDRWH